MELQFEKRERKCLNRLLRDVTTQELTQEVRLSDGMPDIGRVISAWGQMVLRSKEWRGNQVTLSGGVMVWVLYAPEDGSEPQCVDSWIPYQLRWNRLEEDTEGVVRVSPLLRFVDARTVAARKFMVRAGAAAMAEGVAPGVIETCEIGEIPDGLQLLRRTYPMRLMREAGEKTFDLDEQIQLSGVLPEKLISYTVTPEAEDCRVLTNRVVFRGKGNLHLVYQCGEGRIRTADFEVPFSQYAQLDGTYSPDAVADIWMGTTSLELELEENGQLRLKCGLVGQYLVDDRELVELVEDAYGPGRPVAVHNHTIRIPAILDQRKTAVEVRHIAAVHNGDVVDVRFSPDFPRVCRNTDQLETELPGVFQILYTGDDGELHSAMQRWEGKMTVPADEESLVDFRPLGGMNWEVSSGSEGMLVHGEMELEMKTTSSAPIAMVTGLELGEMREKDPGRPSMILRRSDGEILWNLAKRYGSTVEAIENVNDLGEEIPSDRILLIPVS